MSAAASGLPGEAAKLVKKRRAIRNLRSVELIELGDTSNLHAKRP